MDKKRRQEINSVEREDSFNYGKFLVSFRGKMVEVKDFSGVIFKGECISILKQHLNIILKAKGEIIVIKNPQNIKMKIDKYGRAKEDIVKLRQMGNEKKIKMIFRIIMVISIVILIVLLMFFLMYKAYVRDTRICESKGLEGYSFETCIKILDGEIIEEYKIIGAGGRNYLKKIN